MKKITVCTPTFNRAHLLNVPFKSLMSQSCKDFTWIIIDDGSKDNTKEVISEFMHTADFEIKYFYKENGGRHTALNYSYDKIETEWVINLDSDDEYLPNTIENLYKIIENIPKGEYDRFWQVSGRVIDSKTGNLVGKPFETDVNRLTGKKQRKSIAKAVGEKSNCRKLEILKKYPFPVYEDTKFVTENIVWRKIDLCYDTYCTNEIFRIYHQDTEDSLVKGKVHGSTRNKSVYYYCLFCINELFDEIFFNKMILTAICNLPRKAILCNISYKDVISKINKFYKRILVTLIGYPISWTYIILKGEKNKNDKG